MAEVDSASGFKEERAERGPLYGCEGGKEELTKVFYGTTAPPNVEGSCHNLSECMFLSFHT